MRDPVLLEFLGLPETGRLLEVELEQARINKLQGLLLDLGKGFSCEPTGSVLLGSRKCAKDLSIPYKIPDKPALREITPCA